MYQVKSTILPNASKSSVRVAGLYYKTIIRGCCFSAAGCVINLLLNMEKFSKESTIWTFQNEHKMALPKMPHNGGDYRKLDIIMCCLLDVIRVVQV